MGNVVKLNGIAYKQNSINYHITGINAADNVVFRQRVNRKLSDEELLEYVKALNNTQNPT